MLVSRHLGVDRLFVGDGFPLPLIDLAGAVSRGSLIGSDG